MQENNSFILDSTPRVPCDSAAMALLRAARRPMLCNLWFSLSAGREFRCRVGLEWATEASIIRLWPPLRSSGPISPITCKCPQTLIKVQSGWISHKAIQTEVFPACTSPLRRRSCRQSRACCRRGNRDWSSSKRDWNSPSGIAAKRTKHGGAPSEYGNMTKSNQ